jgi:hypothetical protein
MHAVGSHDVMTGAAQRAALGAVVGEELRSCGRVRSRLDWIRDGAAHDVVVRQSQRRVVVAIDAHHVVAEVAAHAALLVGELVEVQAIGREPVDHGHRCVALDAKVAERAAGLALAARVHRDEHRVERCVRVHAARPLVVVDRMAALAALGVAKLLRSQRTTERRQLGVDRSCRIAGARCGCVARPWPWVAVATSRGAQRRERQAVCEPSLLGQATRRGGAFAVTRAGLAVF